MIENSMRSMPCSANQDLISPHPLSIEWDRVASERAVIADAGSRARSNRVGSL